MNVELGKCRTFYPSCDHMCDGQFGTALMNSDLIKSQYAPMRSVATNKDKNWGEGGLGCNYVIKFYLNGI